MSSKLLPAGPRRRSPQAGAAHHVGRLAHRFGAAAQRHLGAAQQNLLRTSDTIAWKPEPQRRFHRQCAGLHGHARAQPDVPGQVDAVGRGRHRVSVEDVPDVAGVDPRRVQGAAVAEKTPRSVAVQSFSDPPKVPKGVRLPERKTTSVSKALRSHCRSVPTCLLS